jgi:hypothetical protein
MQEGGPERRTAPRRADGCRRSLALPQEPGAEVTAGACRGGGYRKGRIGAAPRPMRKVRRFALLRVGVKLIEPSG